MLVASLLTAGQPPLLLVAALMFISFFTSGMIFGNYNAMAMEPMGRIAGMAAAVSGSLSSIMAIFLGGFAARQYDGTLTPVRLPSWSMVSARSSPANGPNATALRQRGENFHPLTKRQPRLFRGMAKGYSVFSLLKHALRPGEPWPEAWAKPEPKTEL